MVSQAAAGLKTQDGQWLSGQLRIVDERARQYVDSRRYASPQAKRDDYARARAGQVPAIFGGDANLQWAANWAGQAAKHGLELQEREAQAIVDELIMPQHLRGTWP
jgi:hypothetical protein